MITAWLSKKWTASHVPSYNKFSHLNNSRLEYPINNTFICTVENTLSPNKPSITKPVYTWLAGWAKKHASQHTCFCTRESCYWHKEGSQFNEKENKEQPETLQVKERSREPSLNYLMLEKNASVGPWPLRHRLVIGLWIWPGPWDKETTWLVNRRTKIIGLEARRKKMPQIKKWDTTFKGGTLDSIWC